MVQLFLFWSALLFLIIFAIWLEWIIGKAIGKRASKNTGIILGIIAILFGFSVLIGIACIIYSQKNTTHLFPTINANININAPTYSSVSNNDTRECPYCAETIKKKATVCIFCTAFSAGVLGGDVSDTAKFQSNLAGIATSGNSSALTNFAEPQTRFECCYLWRHGIYDGNTGV
jgi:hypothetical protein